MYYQGCALQSTFDFEAGSKSLEHWTLTGNAFKNEPRLGYSSTDRALGQVPNHAGRYWISSYQYRPSSQTQDGSYKGDVAQGTLTSPEFQITGPNVSFLIGGGCDADLVGVRLLIGGKAVREATGKCHETMVRMGWDIKEFKGRIGRLLLLDKSSESWGHLNFDDFKGDIAYCQGKKERANIWLF